MTQKIRVYTTSYCGYCEQAKRLLKSLRLPFEEISLEDQDELRTRLSSENGGWRTVPMIFIGDEFIGGYTELAKLHQTKTLIPKVGV